MALFKSHGKNELPVLLGLQHQSSGYKSGVIEYLEESKVIDTSLQSEILICLLEVPSYMIPCELIQFFVSVQDSILTYTIFRHYSDASKYCAILCVDNVQNAQHIIDDFNNQLMSSLDGGTRCNLRQVTNITSENKFELALLLSGVRGRADQHDCSAEGTHIETDCTTSLDAPLLQQQLQQLDYCPVCLEQFTSARPQSFTTACGHTFHAACVERLENPQCPVCRYQHDAPYSAAGSTSECVVCGWRGRHASGDSAATAIAQLGGMFCEPSVANSECNSSGSSSNNGRGDTSLAYPSWELMSSSAGRDLWVCLVCGFTGCGSTGEGGLFHIRAHYLDTLHTYAMNTDNRRVWDFAGDGYVHRLILSGTNSYGLSLAGAEGIGGGFRGADSTVAEESSRGAGTKFVEVADPRTRTGDAALHIGSNSRHQHAPLTAEQEEAVVHGKLEAAAYHYNQLLAWRLQQSRHMYETQLQKIRESVAASWEPQQQQQQLTLEAAAPGDWKRQILVTLRLERARAVRQLEAASERLSRAERDLDTHSALESSLRRCNEEDWSQRVQKASDRLQSAKEQLRSELEPLESQVGALMEKLDTVHHSSTGTR